jgi:hypothetical protein
MKTWGIITVGALVLVAALGVVGAEQEDSLSDEEMLDLIDDIEGACMETECAEDGPLTDEQIEALGFDTLLISDAWGCCSIVNNPDHTQTCYCVEPDPTGGSYDETAIYVGKKYGVAIYDTLACSGTKVGSTWSWTECGGCRKLFAGIERLLVDGHDDTDVTTDNLVFVPDESSAGSCDFADWWNPGSYWTTVTGRGLPGDDYIYGSPQSDYLWGGSGEDEIHGNGSADVLYGDGDDDTLYGGDGGDYIWGVAGDDHLYGDDGDDFLYGGANYDTLDGGDHTSGDYCHCGDDSDPAAVYCEAEHYCDD